MTYTDALMGKVWACEDCGSVVLVDGQHDVYCLAQQPEEPEVEPVTIEPDLEEGESEPVVPNLAQAAWHIPGEEFVDPRVGEWNKI